MKKKKLFIIIVAAMLTVSVGSFAGIAFTTSCGVEGMTVGPDFF